ncbi:MAG: hypothetical protein JXB50_09315 [Spirochaetes bacterium]|nr:hypothetical protein [Spirochaetota bacterium]
MNINLLSDNNDFENNILVETLKEANDQIKDLQLKLDDYKWLDNAIIERTQLLDKRDRELNCLYSIIDTIKNNKNDINNMFQCIVNVIPEGFQNPEKTCVFLKIKNNTFYSSKYFESKNCFTLKRNNWRFNELVLQVCHKDKNNLNNFLLPEEIKLADHILDLINLILNLN